MQFARVSGLDLLRDIAIVSVMLFHSRQLHLPFAPVARFGWMGVDLFFVLSGFLIGGQLLRPHRERHASTFRQFLSTTIDTRDSGVCCGLGTLLRVPVVSRSARDVSSVALPHVHRKLLH